MNKLNDLENERCVHCGSKKGFEDGICLYCKTPKDFPMSEADKDLEFITRVAVNIFGKNLDVGFYDHSGKFVINFLGKGILFFHDIDKLETFAKMYAVNTYDDKLSLIVELRKK